MITPTALSATHMECRNLQESMAVMIDLLAFVKVFEKPGEVTLKHPNTPWLLVLHDAGPDAPTKQMHNHWGVRVASLQEVDKAYAYLKEHKEEYKLGQIGKPFSNHGSYSLYFTEPGTNGWEIECYETALRKPASAQIGGGTRTPHWSEPYPEECFPGRGYVPQGFTHGTLVADDLEANRDFYTQVLGLRVTPANDYVIYVRHPSTNHYVVCAVRANFKLFSSNFRNTLTVVSNEDVRAAYGWFAESGKELGVKELLALEEENSSISFCFRDPGTNWWEITSGN
jgi:catechol 2,3-dioxygenase-like lactoylglutathione lyase family enzyme